MDVDSWQLVIYQARTQVVRDSLSSDARASRLKALDFELRASPFGPTCWGMNFTTVRGPDVPPFSAALLDTVALYLNGAADPVYTGRVSKLPGLGSAEDAFEVQGHYRLAKVVFPTVPISNYSGQFWPKVKEVLETKLGAGNVLVPDDPSVTVQDWTVEETNVKLDALARRFSDLLGGGIAFGFRADGKFVMGRRPLDPVRTLGLGAFEPREAQLANRLFVTTGFERAPQVIYEEAASLARDGPLEETEDLSGLTQRIPITLTPDGSMPGLFALGGTPYGQDDYPEFLYVLPPDAGAAGSAPVLYEFYATTPGGAPTLIRNAYLTASTTDEVRLVIENPLPVDTTHIQVRNAYQVNTPKQGTWQVDGSTYQPGTLTGTVTRLNALREAAQNLFLEKYGPTLRATATLPDAFVPVGGRGRYRYGDGEDVLLIDYSGKYTLSDGRFQTVITGGSKSRYNAAQQSRLTAEDLNRRLSRLEAS
ncbi:hypothetical protein [Deinococcus hopiensis]|uniref:Uncharacterized protein n=1 Tax=Deinococcus hopiensis KR-140 TaxID=695939 RepID=A0A1W1V846_9DEIO|nr:hypothetical protein [Deinococcus hopiensis]SMB89211.1 hypothetical protein SAMN00790413_00312 [Deinococcus hopiensis KR-140]